LMAGAPAAETKAGLAFDQLHLDPAPQKVQPAQAAKTAEEIKPLDFDLSFDAAPKAEAPAPAAPAEIQPLDFALDFTSAAKAEEAPTPAAEIKPLDFALDFAPEAKAEPQPEAPAAEEIKPLDFSFAVDAPEPAEAPQAAAPLSFDLAPSEEAPVQAAPAAEAPTAPAGVSFDLSAASAPATPAAGKSDPLLQSFPELAEVNEISLNLELAQQYIELGSFEAARELLAEKEAAYSPEQRQQADLLLNQIAS